MLQFSLTKDEDIIYAVIMYIKISNILHEFIKCQVFAVNVVFYLKHSFNHPQAQ